MAELGEDIQCVGNVKDDGSGAVTFEVDINGDAFGSTHRGTVTCAGPVTVLSEQHRDGGGHYDGDANGNVYTWHTQRGNFARAHYTFQLAYATG